MTDKQETKATVVTTAPRLFTINDYEKWRCDSCRHLNAPFKDIPRSSMACQGSECLKLRGSGGKDKAMKKGDHGYFVVGDFTSDGWNENIVWHEDDTAAPRFPPEGIN